eukprot:1161137-Pelagomonas_calceolata.AAC.2
MKRILPLAWTLLLLGGFHHCPANKCRHHAILGRFHLPFPPLARLPLLRLNSWGVKRTRGKQATLSTAMPVSLYRDSTAGVSSTPEARKQYIEHSNARFPPLVDAPAGLHVRSESVCAKHTWPLTMCL